MSRTSRRGPPIECPLASLGRNSLPLDTNGFHHPLSSSPLNPQVYQIAARKSPPLNVGSSDEMYSSASHHGQKDNSAHSPPDDFNVAYSTNSDLSRQSDGRHYRHPPPRNYTPTESMLSFSDHHRGSSPTGPVTGYHHHHHKDDRTKDDRTRTNNVTPLASHHDQYFLDDDKLDAMYSIQHSSSTERYYLEDNMCSYAPTHTGNFMRRVSSPSETSGSDRYTNRGQSRTSPAILNSSVYSYNSSPAAVKAAAAAAAAVTAASTGAHYKSKASTSNTIDGLLLTSLDRFSPSLDQGYATLVSPSPSGQQTPGPWNRGSGCRSASGGSNFDVLPDESVLKIFLWLDSCELCSLARVCRRFESLVWQPILWKHINLKGEHIAGDRALKNIFRRLCGQTRTAECQDVERVMLNDGSRISDKGMQLLSRRCPELTHLQIQGGVVSNNALFDVITNCTNLQHLDVTGCSQITTISFKHGFNSTRRLLLQYLDLTDCCSIADDGLKTIVKNCPQLVYLYLRRCIQITDAGLKFVPSFCVALRELSISDCNLITDFGLYELAKLGSTLRYLSVAKCDQVSDAGLKVIARRCYKLRYLNARGCEAVSDDSITVLASFCPRLRALDIGKCDVSDTGLRALAERCPNLKKLSLKNCDMITDRGVHCIAYYCRGLQQLNIQDCQVTLEGYRAVKRFCKRCVIEHTNPGFF